MQVPRVRKRQIRTALRLARQTGCLGLPKAVGFLMVLTEPRALPCCRGTSWLPLGFVALYSACNSQTGLEKWLLRRLQGSDGISALVWDRHLDALSTSPVSMHCDLQSGASLE